MVDAMGKLIKDRENKGQYQLQINLEGVRNGMYLLRLMNEKEVQTVKLIIAN